MAKRGKSKASKKPVDKGVSGATLAICCDITKQRVSQLEAEGVFRRNGHGRFDLKPNVIAYIRFLREENRKNSKSASASRAQDARAREIELRIGREEGRLVEADDVQALVTEIVGGFVSELRGVAAGATRDLEQRKAIEGVLNGAIDRCRARFEKLGADLRSGRGIILPDEDTDA